MTRGAAHTGPREWDAAGYDRLSLPHEQWGARTLARLPLTGDETVLELGCGTGRDTALLLAALPRGGVVALDGSAAMLDRTASRCGDDAIGRLSLLRHDLRTRLPLPDGRVDGVFSVATLHWVPGHPAVFAELGRVLRAGGRLALEYGGAGNVAAVSAVLADLGHPVPEWTFATVAQEAAALAAAGFVEPDVRLRTEPFTPAPDALRDYLATVVLGAQLAALPAAEHDGFVAEVARRLPRGEIDYVRLEVSARRG